MKKAASICVVLALSLFSCQKDSGEIPRKDLRRIFSSGVYFLASRYLIEDQASLDASIAALYADEEDIPVRATQIKKLSAFDEANGAYYAQIDVQGETSAGIALPSWKLTLQKSRDGSNREIYRLFLFSANQDKGLTITKEALPLFLGRADEIVSHFHKANSLIQ